MDCIHYSHWISSNGICLCNSDAMFMKLMTTRTMPISVYADVTMDIDEDPMLTYFRMLWRKTLSRYCSSDDVVVDDDDDDKGCEVHTCDAAKFCCLSMIHQMTCSKSMNFCDSCVTPLFSTLEFSFFVVHPFNMLVFLGLFFGSTDSPGQTDGFFHLYGFAFCLLLLHFVVCHLGLFLRGQQPIVADCLLGYCWSCFLLSFSSTNATFRAILKLSHAHTHKTLSLSIVCVSCQTLT